MCGMRLQGKLLMEQGASTVKRMSMELGGNAPFMVFEDADLVRAQDRLQRPMLKINNAFHCIHSLWI